MTDTTTTNLVPASQFVAPVFGGELPKSLAKLRPIIHNAFEAWLNKTQSARTRRAYRDDVAQFMAYHGLEPTHIEQMTRMVPDDISSWRDHLLAEGGRPDADGRPTPAENSTVTRKLTALRSFFSYLQKAGYRGGNPADPIFVDSPKVPDEGLTPAIAPKQMASLLNAPDPETPAGIRDRAILAMFAYMALRVDELHKVNVGNITRDGEHTVIKIKGKGNDDRRGVLPPLAAEPVNQWLDLADIRQDRSGPLFRPTASPRGKGRDGFKRKPIAVRSLQQLMTNYCQAVGIDDTVSIHSLRVSAATTADAAGISLKDIQHWLGHRDPRTTEKYIRTGQNLNKSPAYVVRYT